MTAVLHESGLWRCVFRVETFAGDERDELLDVVEFENALQYGGVSLLWQYSQGNGSATPGLALTYITNANAAIGAGNSSAAADPTHTNLQGASRLRKGMDATYPQHTDGVVSASNTITFRSTFLTTDGNFDWAEVAIFNSATDGVGRMLNRKPQAIGVKTSAVSRVVNATVSIS